MTQPLLANPLLKPQDASKDPFQDASQEGIPVGTLEVCWMQWQTIRCMIFFLFQRKTTWEVQARGEEIHLKVRKE
jgi:hypothetical protein